MWSSTPKITASTIASQPTCWRSTGSLTSRGCGAFTLNIIAGSAERNLPFSVQHEPPPVVRRSPALLLPHFYLRRAQRLGGAHLFLSQHRPVKPLHQLRRRR